MQRPTGITILALLLFLSGGGGLVTSCLAMAVGSRLTATADRTGTLASVLAPEFALRGSHVFWVGLLGTGAALFRLAAAAGLWTLQPWGRQLALLGAALNLASHLVVAIRGAIPPARVAGALADIVVLVYLSRPHARQALVDVPIDAPTTTL
jgi:uncharacterized membrane protein (DUF2068 family)